MPKVISVQPQIISGTTSLTVNARELHSHIDPKQQFPEWIGNSIKNYRFEEGEDFFIQLGKKPNSCRSYNEFILTIDMAKELCILECTDKAKEVRRYLIQYERELKERPPDAGMNNPDFDKFVVGHFIDTALSLRSLLKVAIKSLLNPTKPKTKKILYILVQASTCVQQILSTLALWFPEEIKKRGYDEVVEIERINSE